MYIYLKAVFLYLIVFKKNWNILRIMNIFEVFKIISSMNVREMSEYHRKKIIGPVTFQWLKFRN